MKRLFAILLAAAMMLSVCACGSSRSEGKEAAEKPAAGEAQPSAEPTAATTPKPTAEPADEPTAEPNVEPTAEPTPTPTAAPTPKPTAAPSPTPTSAPTPTPTAEPEKPLFVGTISDNVYTNALFGIGLALNEDWELCSQEALEEMNGVSIEQVNSEEYQSAMDNGEVYTDVMAVTGDGLFNISASIEKLSAEDAGAVDENAFVEIALGSNAFETSFAEMGVPLVTLEKSTARLAGNEYPCVFLEGDIDGISLYEKVIPIKSGRYMLVITVCSIGDNTLDDLIGLFYKA